MNSIINKLAAVAVISFFSVQIAAQEYVTKYEIGAAIGVFIYQGDLTPRRLGSFETMRLGLNLHGSKVMTRSFMIRANLAIGGLSGDDAEYNSPEFRKQRNFNFRTPVIELAGLLVWNPLGKNYAEKGFSPYFFGGGGLNFVKIKKDWSNFNAAYFGDGSDISAGLVLDDQKRPPRMIPVIQLGAGIRYNLSSRMAINAESSYRLVFTDYLDGFSQAVNPKQNDHYHTTSVGAIYRIGKKNTLGCPVVKY
jgi:Domain of unknown function (DUF6089)